MMQPISGKSRAEAVRIAKENHLAVLDFFNHGNASVTRCRSFVGSHSPESTLLQMLLKARQPLTFENDLKNRIYRTREGTSHIALRLNKCLETFSLGQDDLRSANVKILLPRSPGGIQLGYYLAFVDSRTGEIVGDLAALRRLLGLDLDLDKTFRQELLQQATSGLDHKLHGKGLSDFQDRELEVGRVGPERPSDQHGAIRPERRIDHRRTWQPFTLDDLINSSQPTIFVSEVGYGKTTFLWHFQRELLVRKDRRLCIMVHASCSQDFQGEDFASFVAHWIPTITSAIPQDRLTEFLQSRFEKNEIFLLVDGLDQTTQSGTQRKALLERLLRIFKANLIISSRPSAIISLEEDPCVFFLRLQPFAPAALDQYFGGYRPRSERFHKLSDDLISVPMFAYMIRTLIEENKDDGFTNRAELFGKFIEYIFDRYQHDNIDVSDDVRIGIQTALEEISYDAIVEEPPLWQRIPADFCRERTQNHGIAIDDLLKHGIVNLTLDDRLDSPHELWFSQQLFQEFLAAKWIAHKKNAVLCQKVLDNAVNPKWEQVLRFLVQIRGEGIIERILVNIQSDNAIFAKHILLGRLACEITCSPPLRQRLFSLLCSLPWFCRGEWYHSITKFGQVPGPHHSDISHLLPPELPPIDEMIGHLDSTDFSYRTYNAACLCKVVSQLNKVHVRDILYHLDYTREKRGMIRLILQDWVALDYENHMNYILSFLDHVNISLRVHIYDLVCYMVLREHHYPYILKCLNSANTEMLNEIDLHSVALAYFYKPYMDDLIVDYLKESNPDKRYLATRFAEAMAHVHGNKIGRKLFQIIIQLLEDLDDRVRMKAFTTLWYLGFVDDKVMYHEYILKYLDSENVILRRGAASTLSFNPRGFEDTMVPKILYHQNDSDKLVRFKVMEVIADTRCYKEKQIEKLMAMLYNERRYEEMLVLACEYQHLFDATMAETIIASMQHIDGSLFDSRGSIGILYKYIKREHIPRLLEWLAYSYSIIRNIALTYLIKYFDNLTTDAVIIIARILAREDTSENEKETAYAILQARFNEGLWIPELGEAGLPLKITDFTKNEPNRMCWVSHEPIS